MNQNDNETTKLSRGQVSQLSYTHYRINLFFSWLVTAAYLYYAFRRVYTAIAGFIYLTTSVAATASLILNYLEYTRSAKIPATSHFLALTVSKSCMKTQMFVNTCTTCSQCLQLILAKDGTNSPASCPALEHVDAHKGTSVERLMSLGGGELKEFASASEMETSRPVSAGSTLSKVIRSGKQSHSMPHIPHEPRSNVLTLEPRDTQDVEA